tara:strand:+ start:8040 stop:8834 length:795 start_codon:yes stop_codon:yes gene_type:complete
MEQVLLAGLPRSGSTVLCGLLSQNPEINVTEASTLLPLLMNVREWWSNAPKNRVTEKQEKLTPILKSIFETYNDGNHTVSIDKDRNWPFYLDLLDTLTDKPTKIICTVRPPLECAASFGRLYEKEPETYTQMEEITRTIGFTTLDRAKSMLSPEGSIGKAYSALFEASVVQNRHENMLFLDYHKLCANPQEQLARIYKYLGINLFKNHNFDKITNAQEQNDLNYRSFSKTHQIEPKLREGYRDLGRLNMFKNEFNCEEFWSSWI